MGTGKDTAVDYLIKKYGGVRLSVAAPLYKILYNSQDIFGFQKRKDREFLQWLSDWTRSKNPDKLVTLAIDKVHHHSNLFISDLRFPNEFNILKKRGWTCIKLIRYVKDERKGTGTHDHPSEYSLDIIRNDEWNFIIDNNGTTEEFYRKLDMVIKSIVRSRL